MNVVKDLYIIGAGGFGREVADTVREINRSAGPGAQGGRGDGRPSGGGPGGHGHGGAIDPFACGPVYRIAGFIDDDKSKWGEIINDIEVKGGVDWLCGLTDDDLTHGLVGDEKPCAVIAIADPKTKRAIAQKLEAAVEWATVIHPTAVVSPYAVIGAGTVIQAHVSVSPNVSVGVHCCINLYSSLGHDAVLDDYVSIMSHCDINGYDVLKEGVYVATSAAVIPGVIVDKYAFIGAGSVVLKDVPEGSKVFGNPARVTGRSA